MPSRLQAVGRSCPFAECDGSSWILDEETNEARPCRCREQRIARARTQSLNSTIPKKFRGVGFDRNPVAMMDPGLVREVRRYCDRVHEKLDRGEGIWFMGPRGTGKTTLAMLISQRALQEGRTVAIYTLPRLLEEIHGTYGEDRTRPTLDLMDTLERVDLLHIDDMTAAASHEWVLQQLYSIVNSRYEAQRSIVFTADVEAPEQLAEHVGARTYSRLIEICGDPIPMFGEDHRKQLGPKRFVA